MKKSDPSEWVLLYSDLVIKLNSLDIDDEGYEKLRHMLLETEIDSDMDQLAIVIINEKYENQRREKEG